MLVVSVDWQEESISSTYEDLLELQFAACAAITQACGHWVAVWRGVTRSPVCRRIRRTRAAETGNTSRLKRKLTSSPEESWSSGLVTYDMEQAHCLFGVILQGGHDRAAAHGSQEFGQTEQEIRLRAIEFWGLSRRLKFIGALVA